MEVEGEEGEEQDEEAEEEEDTKKSKKKKWLINLNGRGATVYKRSERLRTSHFRALFEETTQRQLQTLLLHLRTQLKTLPSLQR